MGLRHGMQANRNERLRLQLNPDDQRMCPILWADRFGFVVVMPRAKQMTLDQSWAIAQTDYFKGGLPYDTIPSNIGLLNGRVVMFDYGALSQPPGTPLSL